MVNLRSKSEFTASGSRPVLNEAKRVTADYSKKFILPSDTLVGTQQDF